jgi:hypothetical protein
MTEEITNADGQETTNNESQNTNESGKDVEFKVRESAAFKGLQEQAAGYKNQLAEATAKLKEFQDAQAKAEEDKLKEQGEYEKLNLQLKEKIATLEAETYNNTVRNVLRAEGMEDGLVMDGALLKAPKGAKSEELKLWVGILKTESPEYFKQSSGAMENPSAGPVSNGGESQEYGSFEEIQKISDPKKKQEELKKWFQKSVKGLI